MDIVPIKMMCLKSPSCNEVAKDDIPMLKSLCLNILHLIKSGKNCPPTPIKYQQNFRVVIEEALTSNADLFTDAEKFFLGSLSFLLLNLAFVYNIYGLFVLLDCYK